jgi:hypothetical protein
VPEEAVHERRTADEQQQAEDDITPAGRRDVQKEEEDGEEQEGRAEVSLDDDDTESDRPHRGHRQEVRHRWQAQRADSRRLLNEQGPVLGQVAGEEDDEDDLEKLRRLTAERADVESQAGAVRLAPENERQKEERHAGCGPAVLVEPQPGVGSDHDRKGRQHDDRDQQPHELRGTDAAELADEVLRQPFHEQEADPPEQPDGRQEDLVGPAAGQDLGKMGAEKRGEVDHERRRFGKLEPEGSLATCGELPRHRKRHAARGQGERRCNEQPELPETGPGPDRGDDGPEPHARLLMCQLPMSSSRMCRSASHGVPDRVAGGPARSGLRHRIQAASDPRRGCR